MSETAINRFAHRVVTAAVIGNLRGARGGASSDSTVAGDVALVIFIAAV